MEGRVSGRKARKERVIGKLFKLYMELPKTLTDLITYAFGTCEH